MGEVRVGAALPTVELARGYPYMTSYKHDGQEVTFPFRKQLDAKKLVFTASTDTDWFLVKFTRQDTHRHLACLDFAPGLRQFISN